MILCLIVLKKVNSLLIELGPVAVKTFLLDLKSDLISKNGTILGTKRNKSIEIIDNYCLPYLKTETSVNGTISLDSQSKDCCS